MDTPHLHAINSVTGLGLTGAHLASMKWNARSRPKVDKIQVPEIYERNTLYGEYVWATPSMWEGLLRYSMEEWNIARRAEKAWQADHPDLVVTDISGGYRTRWGL